MSAAFWLPAFLERQYVRVDQWFGGRYAYQGHFVYWQQYFNTPWGFGVSVPGPDDSISFQLGAAIVAFALLGILLVWRAAGPLRGEIAFFVASALIAAGVASTSATPLWEMPIVGAMLQTAQFPWRWLILVVICLAPLAGLLGHRSLLAEQERLSLPLLAALTVLILAAYPYLQVEIREPAEGPVSLASLMRFQQSSDEMTGSTAWVKQIPTWSPMADYYLSQEAAGKTVEPINTKLDYSIFDYETFSASSVAHDTVSEEIYYFNGKTTPQTIIFNQFYYPGWNAYLLDSKHGRRVAQVPVVPEAAGTLGRMTVQVQPGEGYLLLIYEDTPPRTAGGMISIVTLVILAAGTVAAILYQRRTLRLRR